jgi:hypothetical protein
MTDGAWFDDYLAGLQQPIEPGSTDDVVLWPRTPIELQTIQSRIAQRVGASDRRPRHPLSRSFRVARIVHDLIAGGAVARRPIVLDIACGDAIVLTNVQRRNASALCHGVDLHVDAFPSHAAARAAGVRLWRVLIQDLFAAPPPRQIDVAVMLNTYRGWESADLRPNEQGLPELADAWFTAAARFVLLTMKRSQIEPWSQRGYHVLDLGTGEDDSRLTLLSREEIPHAAITAAGRRRLARAPFDLLRRAA